MVQRALYAGVMLFNGKFVFVGHILYVCKPSRPHLFVYYAREGVRTCVCVESESGLVADGGVVNQPPGAHPHTTRLHAHTSALEGRLCFC
jgi:hypothetical protein